MEEYVYIYSNGQSSFRHMHATDKDAILDAQRELDTLYKLYHDFLPNFCVKVWKVIGRHLNRYQLIDTLHGYLR